MVLVVGLTSEATKNPDEAEGHDRVALELPFEQNAFIANVAAAAAGAGNLEPESLTRSHSCMH